MRYTVYVAHSKMAIGGFLVGDADAACLAWHGLDLDDVKTFFEMTREYNDFVVAVIPEEYDEDDEEGEE